MRVRYCDCTTDACLIHRLGSSTDWQTRGLPVEADFDAFEEFLEEYEDALRTQTGAYWQPGSYLPNWARHHRGS